jgi:hypothetical protein
MAVWKSGVTHKDARDHAGWRNRHISYYTTRPSECHTSGILVEYHSMRHMANLESVYLEKILGWLQGNESRPALDVGRQ